MKRTFHILLMMPMVFCACQNKKKADDSTIEETEKMTIKVTSPAFDEGGMIPPKYTSDGQDVSPPLNWEGVPEGTESIALVSDDPDAPVGTWVHWVVWNIPANVRHLAENVPPDQELPDGSEQGITDFGHHGYGGPSPPSGTHRYYFRVYALDTKLDIPSRSQKADLLKAMERHVIAEGQLMGKYKRR